MNQIITDYKNAAKTVVQKEQPAAVDALAGVLKQVVAEDGLDVYRDVTKLSERLQEKGIEQPKIKQVELAVCGSSLARYLDQLNNGLSAIDINNIILSAEEAGLSAQTARKVVSSILTSLNVPQIAQDVPVQKSEADRDYTQLYIPPEVYGGELKMIRDGVDNNVELSQEKFSRLNVLLGAGIPEAYTLMGRIYYIGLGVPRDEEKALEHWQFAAQYGDAEAYGFMGDYYYDRDNKLAYRMYSRPGALALNEKRWDKFRALEKIKQYNFRQLLCLAGVFLLTTIFMFVFGGVALPVIFTVVDTLLVAAVAYVHLRNPYQDLQNYSLPMLLILLIFVLITI